jgi:hypothetical protein
MATYFVRLTVYDPEVMEVLASLKRSRKQSAFIVEALRHFLTAESGQNLFRSMTGAPKPAPAAVPKTVTAPQHAPSRSPSPTDLDDIFRR